MSETRRERWTVTFEVDVTLGQYNVGPSPRWEADLLNTDGFVAVVCEEGIVQWFRRHPTTLLAWDVVRRESLEEGLPGAQEAVP